MLGVSTTKPLLQAMHVLSQLLPLLFSLFHGAFLAQMCFLGCALCATVIVTSREDLEAAVADAVEGVLKRVLPEAVRRATTKPYLTKRDLMQLTGWSSRQVEYKKSKREIPYIKRGRLVLFPTEDVFAYLEEGRVPVKPVKR